MTQRARWVAILASASLSAGLVRADQTIVGKQFLVKDPKPLVDATKRKVVIQAKEAASPDVILGNPTVGGATLHVLVYGPPFHVFFSLPPAYWQASSTGYKYKDATGAAGPVKIVQIKKSPSGTFVIKVSILGKNGPLALTPPNPGSAACMRLDVVGGDRYHVFASTSLNFVIKKNDQKTFQMKAQKTPPALDGALCLFSSTTSFTTTSTSSSTSTTIYGSASRAFLGTPGDLLN